MAANSYSIPANYKSLLNIRETEIAIKKIKDYFEKALAETLSLIRVSAPLIVTPESGLNDNLSGVERPVSFDLKHMDGRYVEIVQSLAKWKRMALGRYGFSIGEGLYTDMNALRRDDEIDNLHSIYVDQWDWELIISKEERNMDTLVNIVRKIYKVFKKTQDFIISEYPCLPHYLPEDITFITTQELEDLYPDLTPKERERAIAKRHGAVCLTQIGCKLKSGLPHDRRAPDYDDWDLNCDIIFYYPVLDTAFEVSSMGIRVDEDTLLSQLKKAQCEERIKLDFHRNILEGKLPYTVGGGLGQSRICMFFLGKAHIGEVQASVWPDKMIEDCASKGVFLL
ncbi:MAG: aspartate--ammonia ligase [Clostridiaceae bacterium]|nr:aspartate--ammonia ligase [Clostridiaceae bacterium]